MRGAYWAASRQREHVTGRETVCLVAHERAMTKELAEPIQEAMSKAKMHVSQDVIDARQGIKASRVLLLKAADNIGPENPPTIYDVELG